MQLVFHAGPMGEFMLLMPLLRAMDRPLAVIAPWQRASLASHLIGATPMDIELFEFTRLHAEGGPSRVSPAVGDLFSNATRIVSFLSSERDAWAENVSRLAPNSELILAAPRPPVSATGHFTDWHRDQLAKQGLALDPIEPDAIDNPNGPIIIHPGSASAKRSWPMDRFEDLAVELKALGYAVQAIVSEAELERWSEQRAEHWTQRLKAQVVRSPEALMPIFSEARMLITNDDVPMHIAAQVGIPTLSIIGPTDPNQIGQRGKHVRTIGPKENSLKIEDVSLEAVVKATGLQ